GSIAGRVEELLARDLAVLDREQPDLVHRRALPARLVRDVEDEAHGEPVLVGERAVHLGAVNDVALGPALALGLDGVQSLRRPLTARRRGGFDSLGVLGVQLVEVREGRGEVPIPRPRCQRRAKPLAITEPVRSSMWTLTFLPR